MKRIKNIKIELVRRIKEYKEQNEQKKEYKENIKHKHSCDCGGRYTKVNKAVHERSKRHQKFIK